MARSGVIKRRGSIINERQRLAKTSAAKSAA